MLHVAREELQCQKLNWECKEDPYVQASVAPVLGPHFASFSNSDVQIDFSACCSEAAYDSVSLVWGLRTCIPNKFPDVAAAGSQITPCEYLV